MQKGTEYGDAIRCRVFFRLFALGLGILRVMGFSVPQVARCRAFRLRFSLVTKKQKSSKSDDFEDFWHAVRDSNPRPSGP